VTRWQSTFIVLVVAVAATRTPLAQETPATFEFSFSNPGARSLGLGGAFAALADDATAAFANPAGLVQLLRPEISIEGRRWGYSTPYLEGGRYEGEPTGIGLDTVDGLRYATSDEVVSGLSFLSFVYPKGRWSVAVYRHQLAAFRARSETQGLFHLSDDGDDAREIDRRLSTELDVVSYGAAGALRIHDRLSLGLGVTYFEGRLEAPIDWYLPDDDTLEGVFGPNSFLPENEVINGLMAIDGTDWSFNAGLLWVLSEQWSVGAFYRWGPEFEMSYDIFIGPAWSLIHPPVPAGTLLLGVKGRLAFPDVYGLGVGYRSPGGRWAVGFEWDRVEYSTIFGSFEATEHSGIDLDPDLDPRLAADDGDELHLGAEYAFLETRPVIALRVGAWIDPDHRFYSTEAGPSDDVILHRALFQPGDDELHLALGIGFAFKRFQIDLGADFSDPVDTASLSVIWSF
jgi:long-subunit fatty acid transport protein